MAKKIRYGVLGLGHIAQVAVLPSFKNAKNSELTALISGDKRKLKELSKKYKVQSNYLEEDFSQCLEDGVIDALYIETPNTDHQRYVEEAVAKGIHVLCEKPLAPTSKECYSILKNVKESDVKFMTAYRLHFDPANLKVVQLAQSGRIGNPRIFNSVFTMQVKDKKNIRLQKEKGGGPLSDIGIYCINASRYIFGAEPTEVFAQSLTDPKDSRFDEVPEMISVVMKFPEERTANFVCSFGAADSSQYDVLGTKGRITLDSAYDYAQKMELRISINDKEKVIRYAKHDQFGAEISYFSKCILQNKNPEPSALEGLADILIIEAIEKSLKTGRLENVQSVQKLDRPSSRQKIVRPGIKAPKTVHVTGPSGGN